MTDLINTIKRLVLKEAENKRNDAGYGGRWDDGGAGAMEAQVRFYEYGQKGIIPPEWEKLAKQVKNEGDPEWQEYQRLRKHFEGKGT
jgi:hypothetical protein